MTIINVDYQLVASRRDKKVHYVSKSEATNKTTNLRFDISYVNINLSIGYTEK